MKARLLIIGAGLVLGAAACMSDSPMATAPALRAPSRTVVGDSELTLLTCSSATSQQSAGLLGLLGGSVSLGSTRIELPLGAVLSPTLFQIVVPSSPYVEVEIHAANLTSFLFHRDVEVTIDYSRCSDEEIPSGAQLQVVYIDGNTKAILERMGGTDDRAAKRITFSTGHLSGYAVAY